MGREIWYMPDDERERLQNIFMRKQGLTRAKVSGGFRHTVGSRDEYPWDQIDHGRVFRSSSTSKVYTGQPYSWNDSAVESILGYGLVRGHALRVHVWGPDDPENPGWHRPGLCYFVLIANERFHHQGNFPDPIAPDWYRKACQFGGLDTWFLK